MKVNEANGRSAAREATARPIYTSLYLQVLIAIAGGILLGAFWPDAGVAMKPLGDVFIKLVKMVIPSVIFVTIVGGIAGMTGFAELGRIAAKAIGYFLTFSTLALLLGLLVANLLQPGAGMHADPATLDAAAVASYAEVAHEQTMTSFLAHIVPTSFFGPLVGTDILQVLFVAVLSGVTLGMIGETGEPVRNLLESASQFFFRLVATLMRAAPFGAFGAMAFTVGKYGIGSLAQLALLVVAFYGTALVFVFGVLGTVARFNGFSIFRLLALLKDELMLVLGTSSSEAALPSLMEKLEDVGCAKQVVGLVVPLGYSFNLDGTNIYMTLAGLFVAQALGVELTFGQQAMLVVVAMISSKGAAGISGAGFVTLAATLSVVPQVPAAGMALVLGVDRFMSECRALTNFVGNAVATIVVARWEDEIDANRLAEALGRSRA